MWCNRATVFAPTRAESVSVLLERGVVIIHFYVYDCVQCFLEGLAVLAETTVHIDRLLSAAKSCDHELRV